MLSPKEYSDIIDKINDTISYTSKTLSDTCHYVVFALLAFIWTILMKENTIISINDKCVLLFFIFMALYFIIDIAQYFITLVKYCKHANTLYNIINNYKDECNLTGNKIYLIIKNSEAKDRSKINTISFYLFILKLSILALTLLCFLFIMRPYFFST